MNQKGTIRQKWIILVVLCLPTFVLSMDNSVLNLALPSMSRNLGSSTSQLQWIVDAYILAFASVLLTTGAIGDRYGRKRLLQIGLAMFGIGSLCAALSTSSGMLIFSRGFLGIAGAMVMPSTLSIVVNTYRDPKERAKAVGVWAAIFFLGGGIGPLVGGSLLNHFYWGSVFLINLPIVAITLGLAYFFIAESKGDHAPKPDIPGMFLSILGLFILVYGIIRAGDKGWGDSSVLTYIGIGILILALFAVVEQKVLQPMLPLRFFKNMSFSVASMTVVFAVFAMSGSLFFLSQYFQSVQGYSPLAAAVRTVPLALIVFPMSLMSARISGKIGTKLCISIGIFLNGVALFYLAQILEVDTPYSAFFVGLALMGIGVGMTSAPATNCIVGSVPVSRAGVASAMNNTTRQIGQALGIAILGSLMNSVYRDKIDGISALSSLPENTVDAVRSSIQTAHIAAANLPADVSAIINDGANRAFVLSMSDAMLIASFILWVVALLTLMFLPAQIRPGTEE